MKSKFSLLKDFSNVTFHFHYNAFMVSEISSNISNIRVLKYDQIQFCLLSSTFFSYRLNSAYLGHLLADYYILHLILQSATLAAQTEWGGCL